MVDKSYKIEGISEIYKSEETANIRRKNNIRLIADLMNKADEIGHEDKNFDRIRRQDLEEEIKRNFVLSEGALSSKSKTYKISAIVLTIGLFTSMLIPTQAQDGKTIDFLNAIQKTTSFISKEGGSMITQSLTTTLDNTNTRAQGKNSLNEKTYNMVMKHLQDTDKQPDHLMRLFIDVCSQSQRAIG